jgi:hypothetical protein
MSGALCVFGSCYSPKAQADPVCFFGICCFPRARSPRPFIAAVSLGMPGWPSHCLQCCLSVLLPACLYCSAMQQSWPECCAWLRRVVGTACTLSEVHSCRHLWD